MGRLVISSFVRLKRLAEVKVEVEKPATSSFVLGRSGQPFREGRKLPRAGRDTSGIIVLRREVKELLSEPRGK
jgi:hypothetical protein